MAKKHNDGYLSAKESRRISKGNRKITNALEKKRKRKNVPESEYLTEMHDPNNAVEFDNLHTYFFTDTGVVKSVDGVTFSVPIGKTVGVVGESGCGKSVTSLSLMQLLQRPQGQVVEGEIRLNLGSKAYDVTKAPDSVMQHLRGNYISMIFQEPMTALNPVFRIGDQVDEVLALHNEKGHDEAQIKARTIELLEMVGIANSEGVYKMFPHELSGGMRQRVMIAMALACSPKLIIADEPTTALDVTIQAQILDLLRNLKDQINSSIMFITHDLGVIAEMADYVVVMYAGRIVEQGTAEEIFAHPAHPYTIGLMASKPVVGRQVEKLYSIPGKVPNPINMPNYCYFKDRCEMCVNGCEGDYPCEVSISPTHKVSCYRYYDGKRPDLEEIVEEELAELLPDARILRMDQDSTARKDAHETMLAQFARHDYDILLGTQMVAKGLDFEKVTLVGVLGIDSLLFGQGFRAYESVFNLITQVVGRGGRAELPGRALIQTSVPDHPVLQLAAAQDYEGFYREEITFRKFGLYPPFCSFVVIGFIGDQEGAVLIAAQRFGVLLGEHAAQKPDIPLRILGPAPMNITMLNNKFRYKLTLKCRNDAAFRALLHETLDAYDAEKLPQKASVILDFNSDGDL